MSYPDDLQACFERFVRRETGLVILAIGVVKMISVLVDLWF